MSGAGCSVICSSWGSVPVAGLPAVGLPAVGRLLVKLKRLTGTLPRYKIDILNHHAVFKVGRMDSLPTVLLLKDSRIPWLRALWPFLVCHWCILVWVCRPENGEGHLGQCTRFQVLAQ